MRILNLETVSVRVNHRGDWLFVRIETDEGLVGLGEASQSGGGPNRDQITATILREQCLPLLRDRDPQAVIDTIAALRPLTQSFAGRTAISACEQALWDIAGKAAGLPVYRLLGGPTRQRIPLYANINRGTRERTPEGFATNAAAAVAEGFKAVKAAPFDGIDRRRIRERDQQARVRHGLDCVAAMREAIGNEPDLLIDCHSNFDIPTALVVAKELQRLGVTWFEEPVPTQDREALARLRPLVANLELIGGEALWGIEGFWPYLVEGIWDVIMPDVKHCGGISGLMSLAAVASARGVAVAPHNPSGPVAMAASAQAAAAMPALRSLEYAWGEVPWRTSLLDPAEQIVDGALVVAQGPGLGVTLDPVTVAAHPLP